MPARSSASQDGLQQQPLLRVHGQRLARADPEERRVELGRVVQEAALAGVGLAGPVGVGVVQAVDVPAAVGREAGDRVAAVGEQLPELLRGWRRRRGTGSPCRRSRSAPSAAAAGARPGRGRLSAACRASWPCRCRGQRGGGGVVEDQGGGQRAGRWRRSSRLRSSTAVSESKPRSLEGPAGLDGVRPAVAEDGGGVAAHQVEQHPVAGRASGSPASRRRSAAAGPRLPASGGVAARAGLGQVVEQRAGPGRR